MITKQWAGFTREVFTSAGNFGICCEDYINVLFDAIIDVSCN